MLSLNDKRKGSKMRKENRKFTIEREGYSFFFCYKNKRCYFGAGTMDYKEVFRYGDDFFILVTNESLGYAGFTLISKDCEEIQDIFFQNVQEVFESVTTKRTDFFKYSTNYQADFLEGWIQ